MFGTFELCKPPTVQNPKTRNWGERRGRRAGVRSCEECRRRKIRCSGSQPCDACNYYKIPDRCHYADTKPSRRVVEMWSDLAGQYRTVLERLFPSTPIQSLINLSREELLNILLEDIHSHRSPSAEPPVKPQGTATDSKNYTTPFTPPFSDTDPNADSLEKLQPMPEESCDSPGVDVSGLTGDDVSDDVNALSLATRQPSTYLGISSINAALKVIVWIDPVSLAFASPTPPHSGQRMNRSQHAFDHTTPNDYLRTSRVFHPTEQCSYAANLQLIDAYFDYIHPSIPLLDESEFRQQYMSGKRHDDRWMALLNMVFALGSISLYPGDDTSHITYSKRTRAYLSLECLGSTHLENVQILGLLGGHYLHYVSQPNLAYVLTGAALRMAAALGLHKEFADSDEKINNGLSSSVSVDVRRRVWWSLFCVDTWGCMTLGRPTLGRSGPAITAKLPNCGSMGDSTNTLILIENIGFCKIATQIQDALAAAPLLSYSEMDGLDNQLVNWYKHLPDLLKTYEPCSNPISTARMLMRWRYYNLRILLHRPVLLSYAIRRIPYIALRTEERLAIDKCRSIASEAIYDIANSEITNPTAAWGTVWHIFQATLVPLLSLVIVTNSPTTNEGTDTAESSREQVKLSMATIARSQTWHPTANLTLSLVSRIFQNTQHEPMKTSDGPSPTATNTTLTRTCCEVNASTPTLFTQYLQAPTHVAAPATTAVPVPETITDTGDQNMWDYISWADQNAWPAGIYNSQYPNMPQDFWPMGGAEWCQS
ncbi:hypothetical protein FQN50_003136 [Emmonsiellopsis sp. PD_5]|nr:hypothetical protein FQN50_003136 [Emmonsiellopsis sp. PD_5]